MQKATAVDEGAAAEFTIRSQTLNFQDILVTFEISEQGQFIGREPVSQVKLTISNPVTWVSVETEDDEIAEEDGKIILSLNESNNYSISGPRSVFVNISDSMDRQNRFEEVAALSQAVIPESLGTIGSNAMNVTNFRLNHLSSGNQQTYFKFDQNEKFTDLIDATGNFLNSDQMSWKSFLGESAFSINLLTEDKEGVPVEFWGKGNFRELSSDPIANSKSWDGDTFNGHLGIDAELGAGVIGGISLSSSQLDIQYYGENNFELNLSSNLIGINPYIGWFSQNSDSQAHLNAGYGSGEIEVSQKGGLTESVESTYFNVGIGGNKTLISTAELFQNSKSELSVNAESWIAQQFIKGKEGLIDELYSVVHHHHLYSKGLINIEFDDGRALQPSISVGLRADGKNQNTIFGVELVSDLEYIELSGFSVSNTGSMLITREGGIHNWKFVNTVNFDHQHDNMGMQVYISPTYGNVQEPNTDLLWDSEFANSNNFIELVDGLELDMEVAYGLEFEESILTPYGSFKLFDNSDKQFHIGSRINFGSNVDIELELSQVLLTQADRNQKVKLGGSINW